MNWLRKLLMGQPHNPETPELDAREHQVDLKLAAASNKTPADYQRDVRRRALRIEVESMRRK